MTTPQHLNLSAARDFEREERRAARLRAAQDKYLWCLGALVRKIADEADAAPPTNLEISRAT